MSCIKRPRRRWLQINLRTLLSVWLLAGCGLGWLGWRFDWAARFSGGELRGGVAKGDGLDPPSDAEVIAAVQRQTGITFRSAGNVRIVKEEIACYVDPPRMMPLVGPAQMHHRKFKCTVYYTTNGAQQKTTASIDRLNLRRVGETRGGSITAESQ